MADNPYDSVPDTSITDDRVKTFQDSLQQVESHGNPNAVSPKGAIGPMQTMPNTLSDPGYGVTPAKDNSPQELKRVGDDYAAALLKKYGDERLAGAAYNAGPGRVNAWLEQYGDPRNGDISYDDFFKKIQGFDETKNYIKKAGFTSPPVSTTPKSDNPYDNVTETVSQNPYDQIGKPDSIDIGLHKQAVDKANALYGEGQDPSFWKDLNINTEGAGRQMAGMFANIPAFIGGTAKQVGTLAAGGTEEEGNLARRGVESNVQQAIQGQYPTNAALDLAGEALTKGVHYGVEGLKAFAGMPEQVGTYTPGQDTLEDALANILGLKGAKDTASNVIEGKFKRVSDEGNQLSPPPNESVQDVTQRLLEQRNFETEKNQASLDQYNANPNQFGVDESGAVNPYDAAGTVSNPSMLSFDPTDAFSQLTKDHDEGVFSADMSEEPFSARHAKMVQLGNNLIENMKQQNLSPKDVADDFWQNTYPELPDEVQARFQKLVQRQSGAPEGTDVQDAAKSINLPHNPDDLQQMNRWYVALMHEANNYPWTEKAKFNIENKADIQQLDQMPDTYSDRMVKANIFNTTDKNILQGYIDTITHNGYGGSLNAVVRYIAENSDDPFERMMARTLIMPLERDAKYIVDNTRTKGAFGSTYPSFDDPKKTVVKSFINVDNNDLKGISSETILHEAFHHATMHIVELGRDERTRAKYPEYARFADELQEMWLQLQKGVGPATDFKNPYYGNLERSGSQGHELIAYGLTSPAFINALAYTPVKEGKILPNDGYALWDQFAEELSKATGMKAAFKEHNEQFKDWLKTYPTTHSSAFRELVDLVKPIIEFSKTAHIDGKDVALVWDQKSWIFNNRTVFPDNLPTDDASLKAFMESADEPPQFIKALPPEVRKMLAKMVSPYTDYNQMVTRMGTSLWSDYKDLSKFTGNFYPVIMVKNIANNPIVTFTGTNVRDIAGLAHKLQVELINSVKDFEKAPVAQQAKISGALTQINRPETQRELLQARGMDENGKPVTTIDHATQQPVNSMIDPLHPFRLTSDELAHYGLDEKDIDLYRRTLQPLFEATANINQWALKQWGRNFTTHVVGYFPRSFGFGGFIVKGEDVMTGELKYYHRVPTFNQAAKLENALKSQGLRVIRERAKDFGNFKGYLLGLVATDPRSKISQIAEATLAAAEEYKRTQEMERSAKGVAGFIGQNMNDPKEVALLNQLYLHHIQMTVEAYKAARLTSEILRPIQNDVLAKLHYPNAVKWAEDVIRRELGGSLSQMGIIDNTMQWMLSKAHLSWLKLTSKYGANIKPNEETISSNAHREVARYVTATSSAYILFGNLPNLAQNAFTIPLVSLMGGLPDSFLFTKNPAKAINIAINSHRKSLQDAALLATGQADPRVKDFIIEAGKRGLIQANMFADLPQLRAEIEKEAVQKGLDTVLNTPRRYFNDPIEVATNFMSLLFYYHFVNDMFPDLDAQTRKGYAFDTIVELTKRYTGDYARYNKQLMFDKFGVVGQGGSNFSIWAGHRIAEQHELVKVAAKQKNFLPFISLMAAGIVVAGIAGAPMVNDYESIRQWGQRHDLFELPPLDLVMKKNGVPEWLRNGVVLNMFGVDLATRGKYSGYTDMGGVTYVMPGKVYDIAHYLYKYTQTYANASPGDTPIGPSTKEEAAYVSGLPTVFAGPARQALMTRPSVMDPEANTIISGHGSGIYDQKGNAETVANLLNFKTLKQAEQSRDFYNSLYSDNVRMNKLKDLKQVLVEDLLKYINEARKGNIATAKRYGENSVSNMMKYMDISPEAFTDLANQLTQGYLKEGDTAEMQQLLKLLKSNKGGNAVQLIQDINSMSSRSRTSQAPSAK